MQLKRAAALLGLDRGQTTHGFRRGSIQHRVHHEGMSLSAVCAQVGIASEAVGERYASRSRHQPTVRKRRRAGKEEAEVVLESPSSGVGSSELRSGLRALLEG